LYNRVNILKRFQHTCNYLFIYKDQDNNSRIAEVQALYNKDNLTVCDIISLDVDDEY
jgi:hypothetical protein